MDRCSLRLATLCLLAVAAASPAQDSQPRVGAPSLLGTPPSSPPGDSLPPLRDPFSASDQGGSEEEKPANPPFQKKDIRDNAFLVEEAYNQEKGVVQHIFNWVNFWDRTPESNTRNFLATYTMELPLGSQDHQFSFTTQFLTAFEKPLTGPATLQGDVGDTFLNYRYQLLANDDFLWCAPRFSLIVPSGDKRFGSGTGEMGYQFNLPLSRYGDLFDFHFNAGTTITPHVSLPLASGLASPRHDLLGYNLGASAFLKPKTNLNAFVELLALWNDEIDDVGARRRNTQVLINPGVRYAVCQREEVEWIVGVSVPIGLTRDSPDIGVFAYMSVEHTFHKTN